MDEISDLETDDSDQRAGVMTGSLFANTGVVGVDSGLVAVPVAVPRMGSIVKKVESSRIITRLETAAT